MLNYYIAALCAKMAPHVTEKCSHEDNRRKVCAPCGKKIIFGKYPPARYLLNDRKIELIKKYINPNFNRLDLRFPIGMYGGCYLALTDKEKGVNLRSIPNMPNYEDIILPKQTRERGDVCNCYICLTGRHKGHQPVERGRGNVRNLNVVIDSPKGRRGNSNINVLPKKIQKKRTSTLTCCKCHQEIGRGIKHSCKKLLENVESIVFQLPEKNRDQIASVILKKKIEYDHHDMKHCQNVEVSLATKGRPCNVILNPKITPTIQIPEEMFVNVQNNMGLSMNDMKKLTNFVRAAIGRKSVPKNIFSHLAKQTKLLKDMYEIGFDKFDVDDSGVKEIRPIIYGVSSELLDFVVAERKMEGNLSIQIMADGGKEFFKVSMIILPENDNESEIDDSKVQRSKYSDGGIVGKKAKLTSVKRLILLCVVPKIKETYENLDLLFKKIRINDVPYKFLADFKLILMVNGQQTASSTYPCPYCFITLKEMRNSEEISSKVVNESEASCSHQPDNLDEIEGSRLKTYGYLKKDYEKYVATGRNKKHAPQCRNTVNLPLFMEEDEVSILEKCPIPELHILQGFVNHIFWTGLVPLLGEETALIWPKKINVIAKYYHGRTFEGNAC